MGYRKMACTWINAIHGKPNPASDPCAGIGPQMPPLPPMPTQEELEQMMNSMGLPPQ
ncbi:hypothetical protein [Marinoscillum furvescens]|uniref:hypothetical protein n=1 Tax=Marinoscillum furvescens TaxID=1026 RepID=UPI0014766D07|nr:hypothetical protein [Marinoscillum furvescens]